MKKLSLLFLFSFYTNTNATTEDPKKNNESKGPQSNENEKDFWKLWEACKDLYESSLECQNEWKDKDKYKNTLIYVKAYLSNLHPIYNVNTETKQKKIVPDTVSESLNRAISKLLKITTEREYKKEIQRENEVKYVNPYTQTEVTDLNIRNFIKSFLDEKYLEFLDLIQKESLNNKDNHNYFLDFNLEKSENLIKILVNINLAKEDVGSFLGTIKNRLNSQLCLDPTDNKLKKFDQYKSDLKNLNTKEGIRLTYNLCKTNYLLGKFLENKFDYFFEQRFSNSNETSKKKYNDLIKGLNIESIETKEDDIKLANKLIENTKSIVPPIKKNNKIIPIVLGASSIAIILYVFWTMSQSQSIYE